jgi:hypothetical protein
MRRIGYEKLHSIDGIDVTRQRDRYEIRKGSHVYGHADTLSEAMDYAASVADSRKRERLERKLANLPDALADAVRIGGPGEYFRIGNEWMDYADWRMRWSESGGMMTPDDSVEIN